MKGKELIKIVEKRLQDGGVFDHLEAEWLVALALGKNRISEVVDLEISSDEKSRVEDIVSERITGKPLSYIIGNAEFFGREFEVDENVLIPRPETEILVEKVIEDVNGLSKNVKVLDLCTGSGAIGITIALETDASVTCSDVSEKAILVAAKNQDKLHSSCNIIQSDLFENITDKFDIIVSNPPYIKTADIQSLEVQVRDFEPMIALDGGESGLEFYEKIISLAPKYLNQNGKIYFEIGIDQSQMIVDMMKKDFEQICVIRDYNKIDRVIIGKLRI